MMIVICIVLICLIFGGELLLKGHVERLELAPGEEKPFWKGRLILRRYHNRGMALNFFEKRRKWVAALSIFLTIITTVIFVLSFGRRGNRFLQIGLSVLLGGAFSNTYDRLKRKYVVDYISFGVPWKWLRSLVFNISDFCILTGALLAVLGAAQ